LASLGETQKGQGVAVRGNRPKEAEGGCGVMGIKRKLTTGKVDLLL